MYNEVRNYYAWRLIYPDYDLLCIASDCAFKTDPSLFQRHAAILVVRLQRADKFLDVLQTYLAGDYVGVGRCIDETGAHWSAGATVDKC